MIHYREATQLDTEKIALLHARSWQIHYRGMWSDRFLDGSVQEERLAAWQHKLAKPKPNQYTLVAEDDHALCGFACIFVNDDPVWGSLLDNLHVIPESHGKGVGTHLLKLATRWVYTQNPDSKLYLWVLEQNVNARKFYERLGAVNREVVDIANPIGELSPTCRYVWTDLKVLID
jgi:GNAT superfamily N-acetyltransferase